MSASISICIILILYFPNKISLALFNLPTYTQFIELPTFSHPLSGLYYDFSKPCRVDYDEWSLNSSAEESARQRWLD